MKLFEGISPSDIPYSKIGDFSMVLSIKIPKRLKKMPEIYNQLNDEITGGIYIEENPNIKTINSFNNLTKVRTLSLSSLPELTYVSNFNNLTYIIGVLSIQVNPKLTYISGFVNLKKTNGGVAIYRNPNLTHISGFDNLFEIDGDLYLNDNPKLILISIPYTLIKSVKYNNYRYIHIIFDTYKISSPQKFINNPDLIQECIDKFNPVIYPDIVVKQIIQNLELWGDPETIKTIINNILSKGDYWEYIPEQFKQYVEEKYIHLYDAKYANTGIRSIAKGATGRYLGMF